MYIIKYTNRKSSRKQRRTRGGRFWSQSGSTNLFSSSKRSFSSFGQRRPISAELGSSPTALGSAPRSRPPFTSSSNSLSVGEPARVRWCARDRSNVVRANEPGGKKPVGSSGCICVFPVFPRALFLADADPDADLCASASASGPTAGAPVLSLGSSACFRSSSLS